MTFTEAEATDHPADASGASSLVDAPGRRDPLDWIISPSPDEAIPAPAPVADGEDTSDFARHVLVRTLGGGHVVARHARVKRSKGRIRPRRRPGAGQVPAARAREAVAALALTASCAVVLIAARGSGLAVAASAALTCLVPGLGIHSLRRTRTRADGAALVLLLSLSWSTLAATACAYARLTQPVMLFGLIALPGTVGGLITASRSAVRFRRPAGWAPGPGRKPEALACAVYAAAASSMLIAFLRLDRAAISEWGLLPALGPAFVAGVVAVIAVVVASAVTRRPAWVSALGVGLVIGAFTLPPALAAGRLLGGWNYKHLGVVDLISSGGALSDRTDLFQSWPGFFAAAADVDQLSGAQDITYANQAALLFLAVAAVAVWTATVRLLPGRRDVAAVAVLILAVTQWAGQLYYSPQSLGWTMSILLIAVLLPSLPPPQGEIHSRLPRPVRHVLSWLRRGGPLEARAQTDPFVVAVAALGALGVIVTHQLSPWMALFQLGALVVAGWSTREIRLVMLLLAGGTLGWLLIHHAALGHILLFSGFKLANVRGRVAGATSPPQELASQAARLIALVVWGGALLVALLSLRRPGRVAVLLALAFAPFLLVFAQDYGGEAIYRVWLFSSPWCAVLLAERLLALRRRRLALVPVISLACAAAFMGSATATNFGMYRVVNMPADEVAASEWYYSSSPPGSVLVLASASFPERGSAGYATHNPLHILNEPNLSDDPTRMGDRLDSRSASELARYARGWGPSVYLAVAQTMKQESLYYNLFLPGALDRLVTRLRASDEWQLVYENPDVVIFRVR